MEVPGAFLYPTAPFMWVLKNSFINLKFIRAMKILKQLSPAFLSLTVLLLFGACSDDDKGSDAIHSDSGEVHSYHITVENGDEFKGEIPKYTGDIYYMSAFVEHNEEENKDNLAMLLYDTGKCNIGIGFLLDENNNPIPESNLRGISFNEWNGEKVYKSEQFTATLENYQTHTFDLYNEGEEDNVASFTLHFEGTFSNSLTEEIVSASGSITIAAP